MRIKGMDEVDDSLNSLSEVTDSQEVKIEAGEDLENNQRLRIISNGNMNKIPASVSRQSLRKSRTDQQNLDPGKKELVFNPPSDKKISNLTISFQVN